MAWQDMPGAIGALLSIQSSSENPYPGSKTPGGGEPIVVNRNHILILHAPLTQGAFFCSHPRVHTGSTVMMQGWLARRGGGFAAGVHACRAGARSPTLARPLRPPGLAHRFRPAAEHRPLHPANPRRLSVAGHRRRPGALRRHRLCHLRRREHARNSRAIPSTTCSRMHPALCGSAPRPGC